MGIVHDFGELISGDYTPHDKVPKGKASHPSYRSKGLMVIREEA
jgi:hypothetical protein